MSHIHSAKCTKILLSKIINVNSARAHSVFTCWRVSACNIRAINEESIGLLMKRLKQLNYRVLSRLCSRSLLTSPHDSELHIVCVRQVPLTALVGRVCNTGQIFRQEHTRPWQQARCSFKEFP